MINHTFGEAKATSMKRRILFFSVLILITLVTLAACSATKPTNSESTAPVPTQTATVVPPTPTLILPTPTPSMAQFCPIVGTDTWEKYGIDFRLVQNGAGGQNIVFLRNGQNDIQLTNNPFDYETHPRFGPEAKSIVFSRKSILVTKPTDQNIWIMDGDGYNQRQLTSQAGWDDSYPMFSADGSLIYFVRNPSGHPEYADLYQMNADGTNIVRLTLHREVWEPVLTGNGHMISFHSGQDNLKLVMNLDGSNLKDISSQCP